jgi:hypothetical protein
MEKFGNVELKLNKSVKSGDKETLLSLFDADDRFKPIEVLVPAEEASSVRVVLEGLGEAELKLGADMEKGRKKTIMTLFWFVERAKPIEMLRNAQAGENISLNLYKL